MMKALFDYVDKRLASSECDDTLHHADEFIRDNGLPTEREGTAIVKQSATRNRFSKMRFPDTGIWPCRMAFADNGRNIASPTGAEISVTLTDQYQTSTSHRASRQAHPARRSLQRAGNGLPERVWAAACFAFSSGK
jgi:hypothetical protein